MFIRGINPLGMLLGSFLRPATAGSWASGRGTEITKSLDEFQDRISSERGDLEAFKRWKPADRAKKKIADQIEVCLFIKIKEASSTLSLTHAYSKFLFNRMRNAIAWGFSEL